MYRVSFRLDKCEFLSSRIEYVGHDILTHGNCPTQSKFDLINDWPTHTNGQAFLYHRYAPYMRIRLKLLRKLVKKFL